MKHYKINIPFTKKYIQIKKYSWESIEFCGNNWGNWYKHSSIDISLFTIIGNWDDWNRCNEPPAWWLKSKVF